MLAACGAAAAGIALPDRRQRTIAIAIAVIAAPILVIADVWNEPRDRRLPRLAGADRRRADRRRGRRLRR